MSAWIYDTEADTYSPAAPLPLATGSHACARVDLNLVKSTALGGSPDLIVVCLGARGNEFQHRNTFFKSVLPPPHATKNGLKRLH